MSIVNIYMNILSDINKFIFDDMKIKYESDYYFKSNLVDVKWYIVEKLEHELTTIYNGKNYIDEKTIIQSFEVMEDNYIFVKIFHCSTVTYYDWLPFDDKQVL